MVKEVEVGDVKFPTKGHYLVEFTKIIGGHKLRTSLVVEESTSKGQFGELWSKVKEEFKSYEEHYGGQSA